MHANEVMDYFPCKFGRDLNGNTAHGPVLDNQKVILTEFCVQFRSLLHKQYHLVLFDRKKVAILCVLCDFDLGKVKFRVSCLDGRFDKNSFSTHRGRGGV